MRVVLVDDEPLACEELRFLLQDFQDFEIVGIAHNAQEAIRLIQKVQPDVVLLDIELGAITGFEVLEALDQVPEVIFVTAYNQYALQAFAANALDYLLKPVDESRLRQALEKVKKVCQSSQALPSSVPVLPLQAQSKVFIKDGEQCFFVALEDIYLIESVGNYSRIFFKDKKPLLHKSLQMLEEKLPMSLFFRANRSQIINLQYVQNIHISFKSRLVVTLKAGQQVEISTRQSARFKELLSL